MTENFIRIKEANRKWKYINKVLKEKQKTRLLWRSNLPALSETEKKSYRQKGTNWFRWNLTSTRENEDISKGKYIGSKESFSILFCNVFSKD